jgi:hypothetical protein
MKATGGRVEKLELFLKGIHASLTFKKEIALVSGKKFDFETEEIVS